MKIIQLSAENVKKLKAVEITPEGNVVVIGGKNGQGKSSVLDSIEYVLAGKGSQCPRPVRDGEEKAVIVCTLDDLVVTRVIKTDGSNSLVVSSKDGAKYGSPQAMLDKLVGTLTFDPLAFSRMEPRKQLEVLKKLVGLDFSKEDIEINTLLQSRQNKMNEAKGIESRFLKMVRHPEVGEYNIPISTVNLLAELNEAQKKNAEIQVAVNQSERLIELNATCIEKITELRNNLKNEWDHFRTLQDSIIKKGDEITALGPGVDESAIKQRIAESETINQKIRENLTRDELIKEGAKVGDNLAEINEEIRQIKQGKKNTLAKTSFPVEGLAFDENGVTYQGLPFEQASSSEQLRVSIAMGLALNPNFPVLLIRDGSLLDEDNLGMIAKFAAEKDAQVWIERVSEGAECQVIMEDGLVS